MQRRRKINAVKQTDCLPTGPAIFRKFIDALALRMQSTWLWSLHSLLFQNKFDQTVHIFYFFTFLENLSHRSFSSLFRAYLLRRQSVAIDSLVAHKKSFISRCFDRRIMIYNDEIIQIIIHFYFWTMNIKLSFYSRLEPKIYNLWIDYSVVVTFCDTKAAQHDLI